MRPRIASIHGEADRLPGLVVDRYGDYLVLQALVQGIDRLLPDLTRLLVERLQPAGILARNDPRVRLLEGLEQTVDGPPRHGAAETIEVREGQVGYVVDPYHGQKTGLFLDQRENRVAAAALRARPRARCVQLQRRIRAGACAGLRRGARGRHFGRRGRPDRRQRDAQRRRRTSRRAP